MERYMTKLKQRRERVRVANEFISIIASHGRQFFHHKGRVSRFELDERGRVWFVDKWRGARIYTHHRGWGRWRFSQGGTLLDLCRALQRYIMGRGELPLDHLGPWRPELCGGDLWGYGDAMHAVRDECRELLGPALASIYKAEATA